MKHVLYVKEVLAIRFFQLIQLNVLTPNSLFFF
jgi:hypothetical protein